MHEEGRPEDKGRGKTKIRSFVSVMSSCVSQSISVHFIETRLLCASLVRYIAIHKDTQTTLRFHLSFGHDPSIQHHLPTRHTHHGEPSSPAILVRSKARLHPPPHGTQGRSNAIARRSASILGLPRIPGETSVLDQPVLGHDVDDECGRSGG